MCDTRDRPCREFQLSCFLVEKRFQLSLDTAEASAYDTVQHDRDVDLRLRQLPRRAAIY